MLLRIKIERGCRTDEPFRNVEKVPSAHSGVLILKALIWQTACWVGTCLLSDPSVKVGGCSL